MKRRAGFFVSVAALALMMCSCAAQAERDRAQAEAARAEADRSKAEAERARAELDAIRAKELAVERAKANELAATAKAKADAEAAKAKAAALEGEMRTRWNAIGPGVAVRGFGDFRWTGPNMFPHPTFKGGSEEAYTAFVKVLVTFLEAGDNFEFMQKNDLFAVELGFGGKGKVRLVEFAAQLAKPGSLGAGDEENRKKLEALVAKMKAPPKA
jgi:hypothetical protein